MDKSKTKAKVKPANSISVEYRSIDSLQLYAKNSRTHSADQIAQIAASITEFGFTNPILVDEVNRVIAGHGRILAAQQLGISDVPAITLAGLTDAQRRAYVIADNKLALNAGWDFALLKVEFEELSELGYDLDVTGFSQSEITIAMGFGADFAPGSELDQGDLGSIKPITCPACGNEFHKK